MSTALAVRSSTESKNITVILQKNDLFEELVALTDRIRQRAFGFFQNRGASRGNDLEDWFKAESELLQQVPVEMSETDEAYTVRAEVPGFDAKNLTVRAGQNSICIHGKKEQKKDKETEYTEVSSQEFCRCIDLPLAIDPNKVSAHLDNGVLKLDLQKVAPAKKLEAKAA
ncbi:Hsp20 family protein [Pseudacidobacterium ailaaui]|jgi:HSP20 family protein|uniref:Hsp20 family protein n=1 Tax=Pseudacidobacterium ailaaui TaxID=1382359 RepID=UPI000678BD1B|nr:Hsp20 family protein [Pseudacidobacterium ailaaui]